MCVHCRALSPYMMRQGTRYDNHDIAVLELVAPYQSEGGFCCSRIGARDTQRGGAREANEKEFEPRNDVLKLYRFH